MIRRPPRSTRTDTLFPYTTLFRSWRPVAGVPAGTSSSPVASVATRIGRRSEEHPSELLSLMRLSYAVFCLTKQRRTEHGAHLAQETTALVLTHPLADRNIMHVSAHCYHYDNADHTRCTNTPS